MAQTAGFPYSCADPVGRLLATLALSRPQARIAQSGTGYGVGSCWLRSGMRPGPQLHTVEHDPIRGAHAADSTGPRSLTAPRTTFDPLPDPPPPAATRIQTDGEMAVVLATRR